jgi:predicted nucleic acid-binding protein
MVLLDTYAWIEYLKDTDRGKAVKDILESNSATYTSAISIAETSRWLHKNGLDVRKGIGNITSLSIVLPLSEDILVEGGIMHVELRKTQKDIGMIDALIYTTGQIYSMDVLTGDPHLKGLPGVQML